MKKAGLLILALLLCLAMAGCSKSETAEHSGMLSDELLPNPAIKQYMDENGDALLRELESGFIGTSGMTCDSDLKVKGNGIVITFRIDQLTDVTPEMKRLLQEELDAEADFLAVFLEQMQDEIPELEYFDLEICDRRGKEIATVHIDEETASAMAQTDTEPAANAAIEAYVEACREELLAAMNASFAGSSGMTCSSDMQVVGNGIVFTVCIQELDDLTDETKQAMQAVYDTMEGTFEQLLAELQTEIPDVAYMEFLICECDGDTIAVIRADGLITETPAEDVPWEEPAEEQAPNPEIEAFVEGARDELLEIMESSFAESSGMTCTSDLKVVGNGIVITLCINELEDLTDAEKQIMQTAYDAMSPTFDSALVDMQQDLPALSYMEIEVCEGDGDLIAVIRADGK